MKKKTIGSRALVALCAVGFAASVRAATPVAVWEGTISGTQGDYTITAPASDGLGSTIDLTGASTQKASLLVKYSGLTAQTSGYYTFATLKESAGNTLGFRNSAENALTVTGYYTASKNSYDFATTPTLPSSGYLLLSYNCSTDNNSNGTYVYAGSSVATMTGGRNSSLKWTGADRTIQTMSIGGPVTVNTTTSVAAWPGVTIEAVALFVGSALSAADVADYEFPSEMTDEYTATAATDCAWDDLVWSDTLPDDLSGVTLRLTIENGVTVTMPAALSVGKIYATGGTLNFPVDSSFAMSDGSVVSAVTIPASATVTMTDANVAGVITVNGTLKTTGTTTLSGANKIAASGTLEVVSGTATVNAGNNENGICGTLTIDRGATFVNARPGDALHYSGSPTVNVYGTLSMGRTRWSVQGSNHINFYAGSSVTGYGQDENGVLDVVQNQTVTFNFLDNTLSEDKTVTIAGRMKQRGKAIYDVDEGVTVLAGSDGNPWKGDYSPTLQKTGLGTLKFVAGQVAPFPVTVSSGTLEVAGATVQGAVTVEDGGTFVFSSGTLSQTPTFNGGSTITLANEGSHEPTFSSFTGDITVGTGTTLTISSANQSAANSITVEEGGILVIVVTDDEIANGYTAGNVTLEGATDNVTFKDLSGGTYTGNRNAIASQGVFWIGGASGEWATGANWSTGAAPLSGQVVAITNDAAITVTTAAVAHSLLIDSEVTLTGQFGGANSTTGLGLGLVTIATGKTLTVNTTGNSYIWGVVGGSLVKTGADAELYVENNPSTLLAIDGTTVTVREGLFSIRNEGDDASVNSPTFVIEENGELDNYGYFTVGGTLSIESDYDKIVFKNSDFIYNGVITRARIRGNPALVKNGTGKVTLMTGSQSGSFTSVTINAGILSFGSDYDTAISGDVTGDGTLDVSGTGEVILTAANKFAISSVSGTGTIVSQGIYPGAGTLRSVFQNNSDWTGSFCLRNIGAADTTKEMNPNIFGNENSKVVFNGVTGYFAKTSSPIVPEVVFIGAPAVTINNGYSGEETAFREVSGTGTLAESGAQTQIYRFLTATNFTGTFVATAKRYVIGEDVANAAGGSITVSTNATAVLARTWSASGGLHVYGTLANNGGTPPSNVTFYDGATFDMGTAGRLGVMGLLSFGKTLNVIGDDLASGSTIFTFGTEPAVFPHVTTAGKIYWTKAEEGSLKLYSPGLRISIR